MIINLDGIETLLTGEGPVKVIESKELFKQTATVVFDAREDTEDREQWHNQRSTTIGGSEIGAIAGFSKYGSALTVFNDKLGLSEKFKGNIHTEFGIMMEPIIREWVMKKFKEDTGINLTTYEYPFMMKDKEITYLSANIDGIGVVEEDYMYKENIDTGEVAYIPKGEMFGLEIKTAGAFSTKEWVDEEIPSSYYTQMQFYMGITGLKYFLIIFLIEKQLRWKVVPRHEEDIKALRQIGKDFWENNILKEIPPDPTGLECETKEILAKQSITNGEVNINNDKLTRYLEIGEEEKALKKEKEKIKQEVYLEMGNANKATDGLYKASRNVSFRESVDNKLLKEKWPQTYAAILKGKTEIVTFRVSQCK
ncbi:YqaJ viral recombinase family protein [Clostridium gasigenes]|uniref:YqaJ viral recombinase family protein n=1 Tax=Clostridium gasigenes TaxID=94869 RepID=A0A7X0SEP4_9CLOT|nr:YqaJ viral recombinase family protein [Clostridium gasigenes]MBB6716226.1 YqaJ viral recombinase family protein [Clostridium gasigenes]